MGKMQTKDITPKEYAKWRKCSISNITKNIRNTGIKNLDGVIQIKGWSRFYTLEVDVRMDADSFIEGKLQPYK